MGVPYLLSSDQIRTDGVYFLIRHATPPNRDNLDENSFVLNAVGVRTDKSLFTYFTSFNRNEFLTKDGLTGVFRLFVRNIKITRKNSIYPPTYEVTYNAHNLVAKHFYKDDDNDYYNIEETIECSLYEVDKEIKLRVQTFLKHFKDNLVEEKGDYVYDFMPFHEIEKGMSQVLENSLYPVRKKRKWWNI